MLRRATASRSLPELIHALNLNEGAAPPLSEALAGQVAEAARAQVGASHGLAVLVGLEGGQDEANLTGSICLAVSIPSSGSSTATTSNPPGSRVRTNRSPTV